MFAFAIITLILVSLLWILDLVCLVAADEGMGVIGFLNMLPLTLTVIFISIMLGHL